MDITTTTDTKSTLYDQIMAVRHAVFIEEQGIDPADEVKDEEGALYFAGSVAGQVVCCARVVFEPEQTAHVQRVATLREFRGHGYAAELLREIIAAMKKRNQRRVVLGAQVTAAGFYKKLGFEVAGKEFEEAGIQHYPMALTI